MHVIISPDWNSKFQRRYVSKSGEKSKKKTAFEVTTSSSDVVDKKTFFKSTDNKDKSEEQTPERKEQSRQNANQGVEKEEPPSLKTSVKKVTKIDGNTTSFSMNRTKANAPIRVKPDVDLLSKNMKLKNQGQPHDEVVITTDWRCKHYKANEERLILEGGPLFRKRFGQTGSVKHCQTLIPKHLFNEVLQSLHGEVGRHTETTRATISHRKKILSPKKSAFDQGVGHVFWAKF